jgi:prevent-host-death family protein
VQTASVSQLKAQLSRYLREVRKGGEVQILDRGRAVARLVGVPAAGGPDADHRERLLAEGTLRPATADVNDVLALPALQLDVELTAAVQEERKDRL